MVVTFVCCVRMLCTVTLCACLAVCLVCACVVILNDVGLTRERDTNTTSGDEDRDELTMSTPPSNPTVQPFTLGRLDEFRPEEGPFTTYLERAEIFFAANNIPESKQVSVFLSAIGAATYSLLRDLLAPASPVTQSFKDIADTLKAHFEPRSLVVVERFHFHKRDQASDESIANYIAELRRLASKCSFEGYLDEALRDRFVCGLKNEAIQRKLLSEVELTFSKAVEIARSMEAAE